MANNYNLIKHLSRLVLLAVLVTGTLSAAPVNGAQVNPRVWADTADGQTGHFLVILRQQANPQQLAAGAVSWQEQGQQVTDGLQQVTKESQAGVLAELSKLGASYRSYWITNLVAVTGSQQVVEAMARRPDVAFIEPDRAFRVLLEPASQTPVGPDSPNGIDSIEWNITKVRAPELWAMGITGEGAVYANADTGVDWDHPALKPHYRGWDGTTPDHNYNWWDAIHTPIVGGSSCGYDLQVPCDDYGHGTHTTGTGVGDDGAGHQVGMAPGAKWIACRNMDGGVGRPSTYIDCLQFFIAPTDLAGNNPNPALRPDAVGNSYGCPASELCGVHDLQAAVEAVRAAGIFMSVSAGNSGSGCSTIDTPPALEASVFTVGATSSNDMITGFSSRGPVTVDSSNRRKPDLVAPGDNVRSSVPGGGFASMSGTSMASPHVAGAVVLLWSAFPALRGNIDLTESLLEQSAVAHTTSEGCGGDPPAAVPNNVYGYGRLDVRAVYDLLLPAAPGNLRVTGFTRHQVDLAWDDHSSNETGFQIERSPNGNPGSWQLVGTTAANVTTYNDPDLEANTKYYYRVRTINGLGDSAYTGPVSTTTLAYLLNLPFIQRW
jgi:serine protease AprX